MNIKYTEEGYYIIPEIKEFFISKKEMAEYRAEYYQKHREEMAKYKAAYQVYLKKRETEST